MPRVEKYQEGAWHYEYEYKYEKYHTGFFHKMFCQPQITTKSYDLDPWHKKIYHYPCGCEKIVTRHRKEEDE